EKANIICGGIRAGYENYYNEVCAAGVLKVRSHENVTYENLYDGINLKWYAKNHELKYDYEVSAGANYQQIQLQISGANQININSEGELLIETSYGSITEARPIVTQSGRIL